jgi:ElaB/YqjD/DUF883 family membrane-anchored ribosome-binding protein
METDSAKSTQDKLRQAAHDIVDKAIDAAGPAAQWLDSKKSHVNDEQERLVGYMSSNPVKALAIVLVVGILIGRIIL